MRLENEKLLLDFSRDCYHGQRFDNTGIIRQIWKKLPGGEKISFGSVESLIPGQGTGGLGLANEFGIDGGVGYEEAEPGALFLKIGVGWLKRPDEKNYQFGRVYEVEEEGRTEVIPSAEEIFISWRSGEKNGYACAYTKRISLEGECLRINYSMENTGKKPFSTTEYAHNFVNLDGIPYSSDYHLEVSDPGLTKKYQGHFVDASHFASYMSMPPEESAKLRGWKLSYPQRGIGMSEKVDFQPCKFAVWAMEHVVSCELFISLEMRPGESASWARLYTFEN